MTYNKLVIRRLPPCMDEDEFLQQVGSLVDCDYFCFFESEPSLGCHAYSRAYLNFINQNDMQAFLERFDNHVFLDKHGREYPAVVEQSFWHKSATSGPFYRAPNQSGPEVEKSSRDGEGFPAIEKDEDYLEFIERLQSSKRKTQQSPIQTIENNLDELTNASSICRANKSGKQKISTPLLDYVNQMRVKKRTK